VTEGQLGAIVLSGGQSRRMGRDKASLPFGPESLLQRVLRLVGTVATEVVVAASAGQDVTPGVTVSRDAAAGEGPLPGLLKALDLIHSDQVLVLACDTPLLRPAVIPLLQAQCHGWDGAVPLLDGRRVATCAVYRTAALLDARDRFGDPRHQSLQVFLASLAIRDVTPDVLRTADPELLSFTPCNTPEEYQEALGSGIRDQGSGVRDQGSGVPAPGA
jgi:molybdenum cofactor guanylyltransferase